MVKNSRRAHPIVWWRSQTAAVLLASVIGGTLAIGGGLTAQSYQAHTNAIRASKDEKKGVYLQFLNHANEYSNSVEDTKTCLVNPSNFDTDGQLNSRCVTTIKNLADSRYNFQDSINQVYIYGSVKAVMASREVARTLPPSLGILAGKDGIPPLNDLSNYSRANLNKAYQAFNMIACQELPAIPRSACSY